MVEESEYQYIREKAKKSGKEKVILLRAKELQSQLSEPGCSIPFEDAFEMAYNEISESNKYMWYY